MRLKTTKRLLNLASLAALGAAGAVGYWGIVPASSLDVDAQAEDGAAHHVASPTLNPGTARTKVAPSAPAIALLGGTNPAIDWGRALRRPLFDPPPPAPVVAAKAPPQPIRARLLATLIESDNSTAMLRLANAQVVFRKVGESLGAEDAGVEISKIETGAITVRRGKEEIRLSVEGANGK
jgi:hypothetical protein